MTSPRHPKLHAHTTAAVLLEFARGLVDRHEVLLLWADGAHPCGDTTARLRPWPGVACNEPLGRVIGIDLSGRGLEGTLGAGLASLDTLRYM